MAGSGNPEVKLLGAWASPYVARARIALHLKEMQYEFLEEKFGAKSELLLKSNPVYKKIPVLIHDGKPVCKSMIIVQYIDDFWLSSGPALMPANAYERAMHRFWTIYIDNKRNYRENNLAHSAASFLYSPGTTQYGKAESIVEEWDIIEHPKFPPPPFHVEDVKHWTCAMFIDATANTKK